MDPTTPRTALQAHIAELHAIWRKLQNQSQKQISHFMGQARMAALPIPSDWIDWSAERQELHLRELRRAFRGLTERFHRFFTALGEQMRPSSQPAPDPSQGSFPFPIERLPQFEKERPILILGMPRSGTTAIGNALRKAPRFFGWLEGHVFSKLPPLLGAIARTWRHCVQVEHHAPVPAIAVTHLDVYRFLIPPVRVCHRLYVQAAQKAGKPRWIDKSPGFRQLLAVPLLRHLYPQARFVFMHRHPLKRALSQLRWPKNRMSIEQALFGWALTMDLWFELRRHLPPESYREVAQPDLSLRTDEVIAQLSPFLDLEPDQSAAVRDYLIHERPQNTQSSHDSEELYLEDLDWSEFVKSWCREIGEPISRAWGYQLTRS